MARYKLTAPLGGDIPGAYVTRKFVTVLGNARHRNLSRAI
jgi:hypothetical protein